MVPLPKISTVRQLWKSKVQTALLTTIIALTAVPLAMADEVSVTLLPATTQIRRCDPLFLKILIHNRSNQPVRYDLPLGTQYGTLWFELRRPGGNEFQKVNARLQSTIGIFKGTAPQYVIATSESVAKYETLFLSGKMPLFDEPGILRCSGQQLF